MSHWQAPLVYPDLPPDIRALRRHSLSRACWVASWIVIETHPLRSALYLRWSYRLAPDDPPDMPPMLKRYPRSTTRRWFAS